MTMKPPRSSTRKNSDTGLTPAQERFCQAVVAGKSQSDAYREAYPISRHWKATTLHETASRLAANRKVITRIQTLTGSLNERLTGKTLFDVERTLEEIARIALFDIGCLFSDDGALREVHTLTAAERACIASIEVVEEPDGRDADGNYVYVTVRKIKLWNKSDSLERLAKHLGLYREDNIQRQGIFEGLPVEDVIALQAFLRELRNKRLSAAPADTGRPTTH